MIFLSLVVRVCCISYYVPLLNEYATVLLTTFGYLEVFLVGANPFSSELHAHFGTWLGMN